MPALRMQWLQNRQDDVYGMCGWEPATDRPYPDAAVTVFENCTSDLIQLKRRVLILNTFFLIPHLMDQLGS